MSLDLALTENPRGKLTFVWQDGDPVFDERGVYPVMTTLATRKGSYAWDPSGQQGTLLYTVKSDRRTTQSELVGYSLDGGRQCERDPETGVSGVEAIADRQRTGRWALQVSWKSPVGKADGQLRF